jgi:hypothetical protein
MVSGAEQQLKHAYTQRILGFRALHLKLMQSQDYSGLLSMAIVLVTDLLDSYKNVENIALTFHEELADSAFENGVFSAFMHSISINHERFDECLLEIHRDHEATTSPFRLLATTPGQKKMMSYYISATVPAEELSEELRPRLWGCSGELLHDPEAFWTTHGASIRQQLKDFFDENGDALNAILRSLPSFKNELRHKLVMLILDHVVESHLPAQDPRRLAIWPFIDVKSEAISRLKSVLQNMNADFTETERIQQIDHLFEVIQSLAIDETAEVLDYMVKFLQMINTESNRIMLYNSSVPAFARLLKQAAWQDLDEMKVLQILLETPTRRTKEVIDAVARQIPMVRCDQFAGKLRREAMYAAFLMNQSDKILLKSNLDDNTLLSLYVLKGNEQFKEALKTPERADTLLAHELGL